MTSRRSHKSAEEVDCKGPIRDLPTLAAARACGASEGKTTAVHFAVLVLALLALLWLFSRPSGCSRQETPCAAAAGTSCSSSSGPSVWPWALLALAAVGAAFLLLPRRSEAQNAKEWIDSRVQRAREAFPGLRLPQ